MVANPTRGQQHRENKFFFPGPRSGLRISSREMGSVVPSRVSSIIVHTQAESGASSRALLIPPDFRDIDYDD